MNDDKKETAIEGEVMSQASTQELPKAEAIDQPASPAKGVSLRETQASSILDPNIYLQMKLIAKDFIESKAIPKCWESPAAVVVGLQAGYEMGMQPIEALTSLYPVNGQINIWGKATMRRLKEHGYSFAFVHENSEQCMAIVEKGNEKYKETYLYTDAVASGYTVDSYGKLKVGWREGINRKLKLRYGVLSLIIKSYIPEVLGKAADIAEVAEDYALAETNKTNQERMKAADAERAKLQNSSFKPKPIGPQHATE